MIRTRFAPSPTGFMHVGNLRTALYAWLYAKKMKGHFILRIEDTDVERSTEAAKDVILESMDWLDLHYDEGPFYQSKRMDRYREVIEQLLKNGQAYRCYCTKERLEILRADQLAKKEKPKYDQCCRGVEGNPKAPHVIRFANPQQGDVHFDDEVYGALTFQNSELDDLIIARSDGTPTYNFTVVVDDMDMQITHVIRGADHINNTPRQINILKALGITPPLYAHLPMILGPDGKRLSKRHGALGVIQYREEGYLPEALLNYLVRLGWSHGDQEIFSREEMIEFFDLKQLHKSPAAFDTQKLLWLNHHYIKTKNPADLVAGLRYQMDLQKIDATRGPDLVELIKVQANRCETLKSMAECSRYFYEEVKEFSPKATARYLTDAQKPILQYVKTKLEALTTWDAPSIHTVVVEASEHFKVKMGEVAQPIRVAMTGDTVSPAIDLTLVLIGKERTIKRLRAVI